MSTLVIEGDRPTRCFTKTPNQLLNELPLSGLAIAIASYLLSKPADWKTNMECLYRRFSKDSKYAIRKAVQELQDEKVLAIEWVRAGRRIIECQWRLSLRQIMGFLYSAPRNAEEQHGEQRMHNKTDSHKTEFSKTDLPEAADAGEKIVKSSLLERVRQLVARSMTDPRLQQALKKREQEEAHMQKLQQSAQEAQQRAKQAMYGKYLSMPPEDAVNALCADYLATNEKPQMDRNNRQELTKWLAGGGDIGRLIDAFRLANAAKSCTAKYVLRVLG